MAVNIRVCPGPVLQLWRSGLDGLEGPKLLASLNVDIPLDGSHATSGTRIRSAHLNPTLKVHNLCRRKLLLGWHLKVVVGPAHRFNEQALLEIAWYHRWAAFTTLARTGLGVQQQLAL